MPDALGELDRRLATLCRESGPLRAALARVAARLVSLRAWERIGYARLSDYAVERLGLSARSVGSLAEVGVRFDDLPRFENALVSGALGWTKVRLLARLPRGEDEGAWIAYAKEVTAEELSKVVRRVDLGSIEAEGTDESYGRRSGLLELRCTPEVRWKWLLARRAARRAAGRVLHPSEAVELVAAEVLSALPIDEQAEKELCEETGISWRGESGEGDLERGDVPWFGHRPDAPRGTGEPDSDGSGSACSSAEPAPGEGRSGSGKSAPPVSPARRPPWRRLGAPPSEATVRPLSSSLSPLSPADRTTEGPTGAGADTEGPGLREPGATPWAGAGEADPAGSSWPGGVSGADASGRPFRSPRPSYPPALEAVLEGLEEADAFEIDERFRRALSMEQRLEARVSPLLALVWGRFVHRALGHTTREDYARERLGMDPTRARTLVRLERTAVHSRTFARAYRTGALSWVKAAALVPLVSADPLGLFVEEWVSWAGRVTVRRLKEDVEWALALAETEPGAFRQTGGLPSEARGEGMGGDRAGGSPMGADREIGAADRDGHDKVPTGEIGEGEDPANPAGDTGASRPDRETRAADRDGHDKVPTGEIGEGEDPANPAGDTGASRPNRETRAADRELRWGREEFTLAGYRHPGPLKSAPHEICWATAIGPPDVIRLFRAVLCTVRRRMEKDSGRLPTGGEALGVMLDHVLVSWNALDGKVLARHRVFARDGWRCAVPGCTSMQNLHDHHIRFRSAQGGDEMENRITLCAFHHLRGVHAGLLRCAGRAPDGLRWEMGIRPGVTPLCVYRSGDVRVPR